MFERYPTRRTTTQAAVDRLMQTGRQDGHAGPMPGDRAAEGRQDHRQSGTASTGPAPTTALMLKSALTELAAFARTTGRASPFPTTSCGICGGLGPGAPDHRGDHERRERRDLKRED